MESKPLGRNYDWKIESGKWEDFYLSNPTENELQFSLHRLWECGTHPQASRRNFENFSLQPRSSWKFESLLGPIPVFEMQGLPRSLRLVEGRGQNSHVSLSISIFFFSANLNQFWSLLLFTLSKSKPLHSHHWIAPCQLACEFLNTMCMAWILACLCNIIFVYESEDRLVDRE